MQPASNNRLDSKTQPLTNSLGCTIECFPLQIALRCQKCCTGSRQTMKKCLCKPPNVHFAETCCTIVTPFLQSVQARRHPHDLAAISMLPRSWREGTYVAFGLRAEGDSGCAWGTCSFDGGAARFQLESVRRFSAWCSWMRPQAG